MEVTVDQLDAIYKANKVIAHEKFMGKTLLVEGTVAKVFVREHLEIRYIVLTGASGKVVWTVRCTFGKESVNQLNRLNEGQMVTVRGKYDGFSKNIILKDCVLVS
ncbi:MAG: hypothetical protein A2Z05_00035 [Chloroflexi bacterium RBG_16_60_22]|nr:MAG: hypothetical protein A2Z05_00035 [Chloroflexi bacterium RBG_16_60_22]